MKDKYGLTKKQKAFCDKVLEGENLTKAALETYDTTDYDTASNIGSSNVRKPQIKAYFDDKGQMAGSIIEELAKDEENDKRVRLDASKFMYDHAFGKATQKVEQKVDGNFNINVVSFTDEE